MFNRTTHFAPWSSISTASFALTLASIDLIARKTDCRA
jgi:hypothetical protein